MTSPGTGPLTRPTFIAFDVSSDGRRDHLREVLRDYGDWVQRSVWVALPSTVNRAAAVADMAREIIDPTDRLTVIRPCLGCLSDSLVRPRGEL